MKVNTELRIQLSRGGGGNHSWSLTIGDDRSGKMIARVSMTDADMGAMVGCAGIVVDGLVMQHDDIGKRMETCHRRVPMTNADARLYTPTSWRADVLAWAEDNGLSGWSPDIDERFNHHRHRADTYLVTFRRWVDAQEVES